MHIFFKNMRTSFFLLCICLSIKFIENTQCKSATHTVGPCGCCPLIGGVCKSYETIDGVAASWHLCIPAHLEDTFSLEQCKPKIMMAKNFTRICRTKNEIFRLFPQCATKEICLLPKPTRALKSECHTPMAVKGLCEKSIERFTFDSKRRECIPFIYSGCGGTTNRFFRQDQCEKLCLKKDT
ncbi:hypothetical protein I4U23_007344 [Adineta vaga]|nr:hypothetical protein I4U23_007344 [Adineta vaga]